jgi:hypothetical protein
MNPRTRREERVRLGRLGEWSPPGGHLFGGDLTALYRAVNRSPVELLVDGEPGRTGEADDVRRHAHVSQPGPTEQPEELATDPGMRHRGIQHLCDPAGQR